jgi:hypothetical protein
VGLTADHGIPGEIDDTPEVVAVVGMKGEL